ncbi:hypothetical protein GCM10017710_11750 [Arthrobacter ramosus]
MDHAVTTHHHQGFSAWPKRFVYRFPQGVHAFAPKYDDVETCGAKAAGGLVPGNGVPAKRCGRIDRQHDPSARRPAQPIRAGPW